MSTGAVVASAEVTSRLHQLGKENAELKKVTDDLRAMVLSLESRIKSLEASKTGTQAEAPKPSAAQPAAKAPAAKAAEEDDDDDVDLFGSDDEEDEEAERIKQERVAAYAAKKSNSMCSAFCLARCTSRSNCIPFQSQC